MRVELGIRQRGLNNNIFLFKSSKKTILRVIYINCLKTEWQLNRTWAANIHNKKYILHEMDTL